MVDTRSLVAVAETLREGAETPAAHADVVRDRVEARDPDVRAFVEEADRWGRLERELTETVSAAGDAYGDHPPLYGVPVGVKDIIHARGLETRAGSDVPAEELTGGEAAAVAALRDAGAVVLGKTVTTEFAYSDPGPTRNPHDRSRTPGGSSSGSAAAVAAGMCPLALGTQTIGSVIRPAAFCGIVGVKPSYGRVPTEGVLPLAPSVDHVGWFTAGVPGARLAAALLCENWTPADPEKPTLGVPAEAYLSQASSLGRRRFDAHCRALEDAGFEVREIPSLLADIATVNERHHRLVDSEAALAHHEWYEAYGDRYRPGIAEIIENGREYDVEALGAARAGRIDLRERIESLLADHGVDVVLSPAAPGLAPEGIDDTGDSTMNLPWSHAGVPAVTVPAEWSEEGLPLGLQCVTRFGDDERLLAWAEAIAAALPAQA